MVVRKTPGCMPAGPGSWLVRVQRSAVAGQEAAEGTLADQG